MNIDADDPLAAALGVGGRAPTIFLQRSLSGGARPSCRRSHPTHFRPAPVVTV